MTIAVGLLFDDGVVICADTLLSANFRKQGRKVWYRRVGDLEVAIAGAGDYVLLKLAATAIMARVTGGMSGEAVLQVVERVLESIYDDHVDKAPQWRQDSGYGIDLLVGVKASNGIALHETSRRAVAPVDGFSCVGSGAPVGNYVVSVLHSKSLPVLWGQAMAAYVIQQTKAYGDDCGGDTDIIVMPTSEPAYVVRPDKLRSLEQVGTTIHEAMGKVLFAAADTEARDYQKSFDLFWEAVNTSRNTILNDHVEISLRPSGVVLTLGPTEPPVQKSPRRGRKAPLPSQG